MKKLLAIMLALVMILSLAACGGETSTGGNEDTKPAQTSAQTGDADATQGKSEAAFSGEITEEVVRNYKEASAADFEIEDVSGSVRILNYIGNDTIVVVPETIDGKKVEEITPLVFANESSVRAVYVKGDVKTVQSCFVNNQNLEIVIWEAAKTVEANAFNNCPKLRAAVLGDALTAIGENAFFACGALEELYVGSSLKEIDPAYGITVFLGCSKLTIKGEADSYIETFCTEYGIPFQAQ